MTQSPTAQPAVRSAATELARAFSHAVVDDPSLLDRIQQSATLVLLPDDDPTYVETSIGAGLAALSRGENVCFVHVHRNPDGTVTLEVD